jgi:hypothetical protein
MSAATNAKARNAQSKKIRQFITPEGVDLQLRSRVRDCGWAR